jgi:hypothetical protein
MKFTSETAGQYGRQNKRGASERTKILNEFFEENKETAIKILGQLQQKALSGDMEAVKLYTGYCFGKPKESVEHSTSDDTRPAYVFEVIQSNGKTETAN